MTKEILKFASEALNEPDLTVTPLPGAGSDRKYFRILTPDQRSFIATFGPDPKENDAFITLAAELGKYNVNVPKILAYNPDQKIYLQEDLGDRSLYDALKDYELSKLLEKTVKELTKFHKTPAEKLCESLISKPFDKRQIMWDLNYFKYSFLKPCGIVFNEDLLEDDFEKLALTLSESSLLRSGLMYRDCQSRNVMIKDGEPYFIDFQGTRVGPQVYDLASLLWQPRAGLSSEIRMKMVDIYCKEMADADNFNAEALLSYLPLFVAFRLLQVLGAYGFRGMVEKKSIFLSSIRQALGQLREICAGSVMQEYPELYRAAKKLVALSKFDAPQNNGLTVYVSSFSYKKGYPDDFSGNGGGFAFDCRAMHNPGRYDEYKPLTGRDKPVIDFLEERGEVQKFIAAALLNVIPAVERYRQRGFTSLQVNFGCTGGRHRSVYCAEHLAAKIAELFPDVKVKLEHREQNITEWYN